MSLWFGSRFGASRELGRISEPRHQWFCDVFAEGEREMFATESNKLSRRLLLAGAAIGLAFTSAPAPAQTLEKVTYLFPAPPLLPAFAPIRLAQGKGYFKDAGLDVSFAVGRGGVDVAKQVGAGNAPIGGIVGDGPIMVRGNGVPVKIVAVFGGKGFMQTGGARGQRHHQAGRPQGQDAHRDVVPGHHVLCAARIDGERRPQAGRRQHPAGRPGRRLAVGRDRQVGRHGRRAGLDRLGAGGRRQGQRAADRRVLPAHGAGHRGVRRHDQEEPGDDPQVRRAPRCAA